MKRRFSSGVVFVAETKSRVTQSGPKRSMQQGQPHSSDPPTSTSQVVGFQCPTQQVYAAGDAPYGLRHTRKALHQPGSVSQPKKHFSNARPPLFPNIREGESAF